MRGYRRFQSKRIGPTGITETQENLAIESVVEIILRREVLAAFVCTPGLERELALGYMISTGIVSSAADIEGVTLRNMRAKVKLREGATINLNHEFSQVRRFMSTECSAPEMLIELRTGGRIPKVESGPEINFAEIVNASEILRDYQEIHKKTRGTHAALIGDTVRGKYFVAEDIGRRNAVDKAIGLAIKDGTDMSESYLFSTGRLTADVVSKCAWSSIPLLASFAVTTDAGFKFAQKANITLVGLVRRHACRLYNEAAARLVL
ncbi:MAG: formate dehydrogenase accessory sulfurtransferase FdhD [Promethearchaeota archaeon]